MTSNFQALILGIVQGIAEFLPISSTAHLILFPKFFGWAEHPLVFDTTLHLGRALALITYLWKDLVEILVRNRKLGYQILAGSIPAGILGVLVGDYVEGIFRGVGFVALFLLIGSLLMYLAELYQRKIVSTSLTFKNAFLIGLFQAFALLPGISRSGATISGGLLLGHDKQFSARISFLLSIPIVIVAGLYKGISSFSDLSSIALPTVLIGLLSSFGAGVLSINFLLKYINKMGLKAFVVYRVVLALILLATLRGIYFW